MGSPARVSPGVPPPPPDILFDNPDHKAKIGSASWSKNAGSRRGGIGTHAYVGGVCPPRNASVAIL